MRTQDRFRQPQQLNLYHPPRRLPRWKQLPSTVKQDVMGLLVQMLCDHYLRVHRTAKHGEADNE
jgi:hypothetical protein